MCLPKSFLRSSSSIRFGTTFHRRAWRTSRRNCVHQLLRSGIHWCSFILHKQSKWKLINQWKLKIRTKPKKTKLNDKLLQLSCTKTKLPDLYSWQRKLDVRSYWPKSCRLISRTWACPGSWEIWILRMLNQRRFTTLIRWLWFAKRRSCHSFIRL